MNVFLLIAVAGLVLAARVPVTHAQQGRTVIEDDDEPPPPAPPPKEETPPADSEIPAEAPDKEADNKSDDTPAKEPAKKAEPAEAPEPAPAPPSDDEVVITGTRTRRLITETPVRTEVVSSRQMENKGARNIVTALENEIGVQVEVSCGVCNATAISLSGMPARFTLMLVDGLPLYSSLGTTYGLFGIPAALIDRLEILKGPASALYGPDAIGGVVNIITKKPNRNFSTFDLRVGSDRSINASLVSSARKSDVFGPGTYAGLILFGSFAREPKRDRDGDGISEKVFQENALIGANMFFHPLKQLDIMVRSTLLTAQLQGGAMGPLLGTIHDFDPVEETGGRALSETALTHRMENALITKYYFDTATLDFSMAHVYHHQDSDYSGEHYLGKQHIFNTALQLHLPFEKYYSLVAGTAFRKEVLHENLALSEYDYNNFGVYAEGSLKLNKWEFLHGARYDYHNVFGSIVTPRAALRFSPLKNLVLRLSAGTGFRAPTAFYEYFHGVHPDGFVLDMQAKDPEKSVGINFSVAWQAHKHLAFTLEAAQNVVTNAIGLLKSNDDSVVTVFNADETFRVRSLEGKVNWVMHPVELTLGGSAVTIDDDAGVQAVAQPALSFSGSVGYRKGKWNLNLNGRLVGPMNLERVYGFAFNPRTGVDPDDLLDPDLGADPNSPKRKKSPWWGMANFVARYRLSEGVELFAEVQNILDYHQSDIESNLFFPCCESSGNPGPIDVAYIWGPLVGRTFYLGAKITY